MKKKTIASQIERYYQKAQKVFSGVRFDVYQWQQKQFDGSLATFERIKRNDTVVVIPIIDQKIVLVKEQQPHWKKMEYTLVAGMVNSHEDLQAAARRELEEETGLLFSNYCLVHVEPGTPAVDWSTYTFVAYGYCGKKDKCLDAGEKNCIITMPLEKLVTMTRQRKLFYRPRFVEDMLMQGKLTELKSLVRNPAKLSQKFYVA